MTTGEPASTINPSKSNNILLDKYSRTFLLLLSGVNLVLGVIFYIYPPFVISYWPWPVKELAVRFLGAIFLAIAFGCWSAVHAEKSQRAKILVLVGGTFFGITGIVSLVRGLTVSSDASTCLATGWATQQKDPERIKVLLPLDALFPSLALLAVAISWSVIAVESPSWLVTGVWIGLYSFVAAGSTILYFVLTRRPR